jgi:hypothetical protein
VQGEELFVGELSIALEYKKPLTRGFAGGYWCSKKVFKKQVATQRLNVTFCCRW